MTGVRQSTSATSAPLALKTFQYDRVRTLQQKILLQLRVRPRPVGGTRPTEERRKAIRVRLGGLPPKQACQSTIKQPVASTWT